MSWTCYSDYLKTCFDIYKGMRCGGLVFKVSDSESSGHGF